ncbi:MAG: DUF5131 family protein [Parafannyhessea sp.]|uniref:DUF5131 family protein n=1 Tax=Parafannyhessea sp. TaxID=2847324 RepID=UPI003F02D31C
MHDIWNPWHGCTKISEGCARCYMFHLDKTRGLDGGVVRRNKTTFDYPLQRDRTGAYKVKSGELIRVCMNSDFFVPEADQWRDEAWGIIHARPDVKFYLLTKRPERMAECLPADWGDGWDNVMLNVTCENQRRADERIPILLSTPAAHKGIMCAPFIGPVDIERYLCAGDQAKVANAAGRPYQTADGLTVNRCGIEEVKCGGENYEDPRPCHFSWVRRLSAQCQAHDVTFAFIETGTRFVVGDREYHIPRKDVQAQQAYRSGVEYSGAPLQWHLTDPLGLSLPPECLYQPRYRTRCMSCGSHLICNGCCNCGLCGELPEELRPWCGTQSTSRRLENN